MILYAETSAVLRWLLGAPRGNEVRMLLAAAAAVVTSRLTIAEAHRSLIAATTRGEIDEAAAEEARRMLAIACAGWTIVEIVPEIADQAGLRFPVEPVRTLDALHLRTALFITRELGPLRMLSTDNRILDNSPHLGLELALPRE